MCEPVHDQGTLTRQRLSLLGRAVSGSFGLSIRLYQALIRPFLWGSCRFVPTCSEYALEAINTHGPARGIALTLRRLSKCHPFSKGGMDPVPEREHPEA